MNESEKKYLEVKRELEEWANKCEQKPIYDDAWQDKYYLYYSYNTKTLEMNEFSMCKTAEIAFTDENIMWEAVRQIGEERIIIDYLGVEDYEC